MSIKHEARYLHMCDVEGCETICPSLKRDDPMPGWAFMELTCTTSTGAIFTKKHMLCPKCNTRLCDVMRDASFGFAQ